MIEIVAVIGAGAMGSQIGLVAALAGHSVRMIDISPEALELSNQPLRDRMTSQVARGSRTAEDLAVAFSRIQLQTDLSSSVADATIVIEAVVEDVVVKRTLFETLGSLCHQDVIFASNTSSFVPSKLADATGWPGNFINLHFFNPALVMECVEVVRGPETTDETVARSISFVESLGKAPILISKEKPGFIANRFLSAVRDEAIRLYEEEIASIEAIDTVCRLALGYPMGPFQLMDFTGIDIGYMASMGRYAESQDPNDLPSKTVTEKVERGHLGRKTGRGFYTYYN